MHRSPVAILLRTRHLLGSPMTIKQHTTPLVLKVSSESSNPYVLKMPITTSTSTSKPAPPATRSKHEWLVILPDHDGILEKRMSVRQNHLKELQPKVEEGFWTLGGAILDEPLRADEGPKIKGSVMLASADTEAEVVEQLKQDTYFKSGVWDWDKVQILPFKSMVRKEL